MAQRRSIPPATDWRAALLADVIRRPASPGAPNRLHWPDYDGRPALWWGTGPVEGVPAVVAVWDFTVHGGSFGEADAAAFTAAAGAAVAGAWPLVSLVRSGGTRLQEGVAGLVGLARVSLALGDVARAGLAHIAVSDHPTTGGMWVTVGSRADLRCAVLGATVGFAGPRVVAAVTGELPPPNSHTALSAQAAGLVDAAVEPSEVADWLRRALCSVGPPRPATAVTHRAPADGDGDGDGENGNAEDHRSGWEQVQVARRGPRRAAGLILGDLLPDGVDLAGPDRTVRARAGRLAGTPVVGVALAAGRDEAPGPDGYRLLTRAADLAGRLGLPLITLVDTPGAACGPAAEAGGVAREIGAAMAAVLGCPSPTISIVLGEGGSGGALAACCTDVVLLSPDGYLTALSPEGAATTLRITPAAAADSAGLLPRDLTRLGFADGVLARSDTDLPGLTHRVRDLLDVLTKSDSYVRLAARKTKWSTGLGGFQ
ncbi:acetyl-CoA carboxylase subunit alpha/beta [Parafrankia colletiae]|uniref:acetyl-CoA carboxytransferase n=1 Tax=Parafrankia colletiae TaxID=573497 RepID=A0A1S1QYZ3_9ACTN|nr:carboxyl transferase domain-containing protein [Parafrankia colletiae]MCK9900640.1 acetyl-CoA carboxylase subunit alpha/beta [Frankia sp. Cpl3]OHV38907.1 acetyl-CoA carboxylase subunit alpha/beta [Parafrankia colletiae]